MPVSPDVLHLHLAYSAWADQRILDAVATLTPEERDRDFHTADKSVLGTLGHLYAADRIWLARIEGTPQITAVRPEDRDFEVLRVEWPALHLRWQQWGADLTEQTVLEALSYRDTKGNPWRNPLWEIVLHVVNHGTHHRGAVSGFLRAMGHTPPPLDLIAFYRARAGSAAR